MKYMTILAAAFSLLLAGCASTLRSDVTAFHQWPAGLQDKSYVFVAPPAEADTLEYRNYLNLLRVELGKQGFSEADAPEQAALRVAMRFSSTDHALRVIESMDPFWTGRGYWPGLYGYPWGMRGWYGTRYYDPFLYGPPDLRETVRHEYERQLQVSIDGRDGSKLFDVTVHNSSRKAATPLVMPAMFASAFAGFPGQSGVPHRVDLKVE